MGKKNKGNNNNNNKSKKQRKIQPEVDLPHNVRKEETPSKLSSWHALATVVVVGIAIFIQDFYLKDTITGASIAPVDPVSMCTITMSNSSLPNGGWGMYRLTDAPRGTPISYGDVVIPVPDVTNVQYDAIQHFLHHYMWHANVAGGSTEGVMVHSAMPGIGSLVNGHPSKYNVAPQPGSQVDEAGVSRIHSPGAGAFSHYHGLKYFAHKDVLAGDEIFVDYGRTWEGKIPQDMTVSTSKSVEWLRENGMCADHIRPGLSSLAHAGRGAIATRDLVKGTVVAPAPLIPIFGRHGMDLGKNRTKQLLLNYCLGHPNSSLLLFPYAPTVNLINHHPQHANVELRWSESTLHYNKHLLNEPISSVKANPYGLLMEFVAIKDIQEGEEVMLNYGQAWQEAFQEHMLNWKATVNNDYKYSRELNRQIDQLRTVAELLTDPYPSHVTTRCFYQFDPNAATTGTTRAVRWETSKHISELSNLYPCNILERDSDEYTVEILNQEDLTSQQQKPIPPGHTVTNVPRRAIRIADKLYASDQHLPNAFRLEIGVPDKVFPKVWMDLA